MGGRDGRQGSEERDLHRPSVSRRRLVAAGVGAALAAGAAAVLESCEQGTPTGTGGAIELTINGKKHTIRSAPDTPLLYVLRDELGLVGTRFGCGLGQCGACAVLIGGRETRSCMTVVSGIKDEITTVEGLPALWVQKKGLTGAKAAQALHPVQQAWIEEQVPQCGYCQSGMMIMAVDLLSRIPHPTEAQIRKAFTDTPPSAHLCRCGTYDSIIRAVQRAARSMA
ncbi:MAG TPA: (2Fe-2S)-binding protein [Candidatus Dormibacteraeota bacterium]|nr:(2Fe-2S)-binding protein [Candidatus Dormibacteraeota bacterium]